MYSNTAILASAWLRNRRRLSSSYNRYCSRCHQLGRGVLPDLRRLTPEKHALFYDIVLKGLLKGAGMAQWDDVLSRNDVEAIHAYLVDESWKAFVAEQGPATH